MIAYHTTADCQSDVLPPPIKSVYRYFLAGAPASNVEHSCGHGKSTYTTTLHSSYVFGFIVPSNYCNQLFSLKRVISFCAEEGQPSSLPDQATRNSPIQSTGPRSPPPKLFALLDSIISVSENKEEKAWIAPELISLMLPPRTAHTDGMQSSDIKSSVDERVRPEW